MFKISSFILIFIVQNSLQAQTNLIGNGSFEDVDNDVKNIINNASGFPYSHLGDASNTETASLFGCWQNEHEANDGAGDGRTFGICWGIVPGLFAATGGSLVPYGLSNYPMEEAITNAANGLPKAFKGTNDDSGLTLELNPDNNLFGIDLSPPTSKFGANVDATDGTNYLALFDQENAGWNMYPYIKQKLKYDLVKGLDYTFSIDYAQMNLIEAIKSSEGWDQVKNGKIKVWFFSDGNEDQDISDIDIDDVNWKTKLINFRADQNWTHIKIRYNPVRDDGLDYDHKIGGIFIDNLKLYEACETNENMCNNANYRRDMLDVDLQVVNLETPLAFPDPEDNSNDPGILKSIRAINLENVKQFTMLIYNPDDVLVKTLNVDYPPSTYVWDGRNDEGIMQPDGNNYEARIHVKNDCFQNGGYDPVSNGTGWWKIKNFDLKSKYSVFNINMINASGILEISGLANVHQMNVKIYTEQGQFITEFDITNPRSTIAISKQSLSAATGIAELSGGAPYTVRVYVINNCNRSSVFVKNSCLIGDQLENQGAAYDEMFDYVSIAKNPIFQCPYEVFYNHNLLPPMNCCEGNLYLNNVDIWTSWTVNIQGNIYIGSNTTFEEGSSNALHAGEQIILDPTDQTITINNQTTILKPNTFECEICKMYEITANEDEDNENDRELVNLIDTSTSLIQDFVVYPNPFSSGEITINSNISRINIKNLKLELTNSVGLPIPIIITSKNARMIKFKLTQKPASGIYYIYYVSDGIEKTFPLVIQD